MTYRNHFWRSAAGAAALSALSCLLAVSACDKGSGAVSHADGASDGGSPCNAGAALRITTGGCGEDVRPICTTEQVTCPAVVCGCSTPNNIQSSFRRCDNPLVPFAYQGPCEADARCMLLDEAGCKADRGCFATYGETVDGYCMDANQYLFAGCRRGLEEHFGCGLGITFARDPTTDRILVFKSTCTPVGWAHIPGSCTQRP